MPTTHVRVPGGGNTYVRMGLTSTIKVEFMANVNDQPGAVVGSPEQIQPIGATHPIEIATGYAMAAGTLTIKVWPTWGKDGWVSAFMTTNSDGSLADTTGIWDNFISGATGNNSLDHYPVDLYEVLEAQRMNNDYLTVQKVEKDASGDDYRIKNYKGCVITQIDAGENINNAAMPASIQTTITVMYTHVEVVTA